jgi:hypothetical protein
VSGDFSHRIFYTNFNLLRTILKSQMKTKYRVLCLHGYRQNAIKLRGRIAALRRAFKASVEFGKLIVLFRQI